MGGDLGILLMIEILHDFTYCASIVHIGSYPTQQRWE